MGWEAKLAWPVEHEVGLIFPPLGRARGEPCPTPGQISWAPVGARNVVNSFRTSFVAAPWSPFLPLLVAGPKVRLQGTRRRGDGICLSSTRAGGDGRSPWGEADGETEYARAQPPPFGQPPERRST